MDSTPPISQDTVTATGGSSEKPADRSPIKMIIALVQAMRPKQALKNLFVFAALVFAGRLTDRVKGPRDFALTLLAFFLFTVVAGSVYILNDILDVDQDRIHPDKCNRPIASGLLPIPLAWAATALIAVLGLASCFIADIYFGTIVAVYF